LCPSRIATVRRMGGLTMTDAVPFEIDISGLPRIRPLLYQELDPQIQALWDEIYNGSNDPRDEDLKGTAMWNPELNRLRSPFANYVKHSSCLPARNRELAILRTAWNCGADFIWAMHSEIGLRCGLSQDDIDRVGAGSDDPGWTHEEAAVLLSM